MLFKALGGCGKPWGAPGRSGCAGGLWVAPWEALGSSGGLWRLWEALGVSLLSKSMFFKKML